MQLVKLGHKEIFMKIIILTVLVLTSFVSQANGLDLFVNSKKYSNTIANKLPNYEVELKKNIHLYTDVAIKVAHELEIDYKLVLAVIWTESHFKSEAKSKVGAKGLMQIMPKTRKSLLKDMKNFNSILTSHLKSGLSYKELEDIILGSYYLKKLHKKFNNTELTIIAYNMGPTWVQIQLNNNRSIGVKNDYLNKVKGKITLIASTY
jgi:soluble lytic murein transglycosylase-like protein